MFMLSEEVVKRAVTLALALVIVPYLILSLPKDLFFLLILPVFALLTYEWARLCFNKHIYILLYILLMLGLAYWLIAYFSLASVLQVSVYWWLLAFILVLLYNFKPNLFNSQSSKIWQGLAILAGPLTLLPFLYATTWFAAESNRVLLLLFLSISLASDVFAYLVGKTFGRVRLLPNISPNKTLEGFLGAIFGGISISALFYTYTSLSFAPSLVCLLVVVAVLGDLFESLLKRVAKVKDSGALFPGHGGILDSIDSHLSLLPIALWLIY